jgi:hypothetical protein
METQVETPQAAPEQTEAQQGEALDTAIAESEENQGPIAEAPEANIEELATAEIDDDIVNGDENYKGIDYNQVINDLPEDAKKIVANLRRSFTTKSQEVAEQRKKLESVAADLASQREALIQSDFFEDIKEKSVPEDGATFDPYDPTSVEKRIEKEVALRLRQMLEPMHAEHRIQQQKNQVAAFKQQHPDLEDIKMDVASALREHEHLSLEQAYWQVKGQKLAGQEKETKAELKRYRQAAKDAGLKVGGASRGKSRSIPKYVEDQGAVAIYHWLQANPHVKI